MFKVTLIDEFLISTLYVEKDTLYHVLIDNINDEVKKIIIERNEDYEKIN